MPAKSTSKKPSKPYPDFPLFPHATGRWAKKIRGKLHYFGPWGDPDGALEQYQRVRDDLYAGRTPRPAQDGVEVRDVANTFLASRERKVEAGELKRATLDEYIHTMRQVSDALGRRSVVEGLRADDFARLRAVLAKRYGPAGVSKRIQITRMAFKHAWEADLIDRPPKYGPEFKRPSRAVFRRQRESRPSRMFEADELRTIVEAARRPLRAIILLGINCGWGQYDIANVEQRHFDLDAGTVNFPRPKTGIEREAVLWPETVAAVWDAIEHRPDPENADHDDLVFLTRWGRPWVRYESKGDGRGVAVDSVNLQFNKLLKRLSLKRQGVAFYALRHTFQTVAEGCGDPAAVERIMGHSTDDMASRYRERIDRDRLQRVADHVRGWLGAGA